MAASPARGPYLVLGYSEIFSVYVGGEGHKGTCLLIWGLSSALPNPPSFIFLDSFILKNVHWAP